MRKGWQITSLIILMMLSLVISSFAKSSKVGTSGAQFLKIGVGGRATAMGGVYTGVADDISAIYWNPGGIAQIQSKEILLMQNYWFQDISHQFAAFAMPVGNIGVFGLSATLLQVKDLEKRTVDAVSSEGTFKSQDQAIALTYGRRLGEKLTVGGNVKMLSSKIDTENASAVAADVGALMKTGVKGLNVGLAVTNIGGKYKFIDEGDKLPMAVKLGGGYKILNDSLTLALDVIYPNDNDLLYGAGVEYALKFGQSFDMALRTGYRTGVDTGGLSGLAAGVGFTIKKMIGIDFAWAPYGDLGNSYRVSLSGRF